MIQTEIEVKQAGSALEDYQAPAMSLETSREVEMVGAPTFSCAYCLEVEVSVFNWLAHEDSARWHLRGWDPNPEPSTRPEQALGTTAEAPGFALPRFLRRWMSACASS